MDFKKPNKSVKGSLRKAETSLNKSLDGVDRADKIAFFKQVINAQSPGSKRDLASSSTTDVLTSDDAVGSMYTELKGKRDNVSNCVK